MHHIRGGKVSRQLEFKDAVRLLGGQDNKIIDALDRISSGILFGASIRIPALLGLFEARAEFIRLSKQLVNHFSQSLSGLTRWGRTQRLEAANGVLLLTAFFEALSNADLPFAFADFHLTKQEQIAIATHQPSANDSAAALSKAILEFGQQTTPQPEQSFEKYIEFLQVEYYTNLCGLTTQFMMGLAAWQQRNETEQDKFLRALKFLPRQAAAKYTELFRQLAAQFPELAFWSNMHEHQATRARIAEISIAFERMAEVLTKISSAHNQPDELRASLVRAYSADLDRSIVESGDIPEGIKVPVLGKGYIPPLFRVCQVSPGVSASSETLWQDVAVRSDMENFLIGHLTSSRATRAPLLVLGQPGSGKSVLTRVLAARLLPADFMPIRVVLRDVQTTSDIQDQVEIAIRTTTGDHSYWPTISRNAKDAVPVIMLDGFDELLQATGVSQSDYLLKVAKFQQRESDQGRPVAVIVTSRMSVADRARAPEETVALRLEPFDDKRVKEWLNIWNSLNASQFEQRGLKPLRRETVFAHRELAEQPLLLLMLALYDAEGNDLQDVDMTLGKADLYNRLLTAFTTREVAKQRAAHSANELHEGVEEELRRLSIVAFAMFNRGSQWVTDDQIDTDMAALQIGQRVNIERADMRRPLTSGELTLGRFFFVHRTVASEDKRNRETYEFLHSTFGEFLVARLVKHILNDIVSANMAPRVSGMPRTIDDSLLFTFLSFTPLTSRSAVLDFLREMLASRETLQLHRMVALEDDALGALICELFRSRQGVHMARELERYQPRHLSDTARCAIYSANLVLLATCVSSWTAVSTLFGSKKKAVERWSRQAQFWRSQFDIGEWKNLCSYLSARRIFVEVPNDAESGQDTHIIERDLVICVESDNDYDVDGRWIVNSRDRSIYAIMIGVPSGADVGRELGFVCDREFDIVFHSVKPLIDAFSSSFDLFVNTDDTGEFRSPVRALLEAWLQRLGFTDGDDHRAIYQSCLRISVFADSHSEGSSRHVRLLLDVLRSDVACPASVVAEVLDELVDYIYLNNDVGHFNYDLEVPGLVRCALAFLGIDPDADRQLALVIQKCRPSDIGSRLLVEAWMNLAERGLPLPHVEMQMMSEIRSSAAARFSHLARILHSIEL